MHQKGKFVSSRKEDPLAINVEGEEKTTTPTFTKTLTTRRKAWKFLARKESAKHTNGVPRSLHPRVLHIYTITTPSPSPDTSALIFHPSRGRRRITRERFALLIRAHAPERTRRKGSRWNTVPH